MKAWVLSGILLAGLSTATALRADTVILENGDRISGRVLGLEAGDLLFESAYSGQIKLPWAKVIRLESDAKVRVQLADGSLLNGQLLPAPEGRAKVKISDVVETAAIPLTQVTALNPPEDRDKVKFSGRANVGGNYARGNTEEDVLHADGEWVARSPSNRYTLGAELNEASSNGATTTSNARMVMKYDHFINSIYLYATGLFEQDEQADLSLRTSLGVGAGRQIYEENARNLSIEGGLSYVNEDYELSPDQRFPSLRLALKYDQLFWGERLKFFHASELLGNLEDSADYLLKTRTGIRIPVGKSLQVSTQINLDYDGLPAPGKDEVDTALIFSVGYGF